MSGNDCKEKVALLKGMGLAGLGLEKKHLKRLRKSDADRFSRMTQLLKELDVSAWKVTPSFRLFVYDDRNGTFQSIFTQPEVVFTASPLDLATVETLWSVRHINDDTPVSGTINEKLYEVIQEGLLPLRVEPGNPKAGKAVPCSHLVYLNEHKKSAYFVAGADQSTRLERALAPFVNYTRRSRASSDDFYVAETIETLQRTRAKLEKLLTPLTVDCNLVSTTNTVEKKKKKKQKKEKKSEKPKKAIKPVTINTSLIAPQPAENAVAVADMEVELRPPSVLSLKRAIKSPRPDILTIIEHLASKPTESHEIVTSPVQEQQQSSSDDEEESDVEDSSIEEEMAELDAVSVAHEGEEIAMMNEQRSTEPVESVEPELNWRAWIDFKCANAV